MKTKGWKNIFAFTFLQQIKTKSFIISTAIIATIIALIAATVNILPAVLLEDELTKIEDTLEGDTDAFTIDKLYIANETDLNISFTVTAVSFGITTESLEPSAVEAKINELAETTENQMLAHITDTDGYLSIDAYYSGINSTINSSDCSSVLTMLANQLDIEYLSSIGMNAEQMSTVMAGVSTSRDAMKLLGEISKKSEILEGAYAITSDGRSVSIVADVNKYTTYQPIEAAIDIFIERSVKCCDLDIKAGVISSGVVDLLAKQTALDDIENEERWAHVREVIGDEDIYLAFRDMMESIFAKEMIPLIASFYDPATGMFYCSGSGKRAEGIYPIPEGTSQVLGYMQSTGMLRKFGKKYAVPELTRHRIIYHLKSIQGEDGEFYVSQMKKNTIDSNRIGRDRGHCRSGLCHLLPASDGASPAVCVLSARGAASRYRFQRAGLLERKRKGRAAGTG